MNLREKIIRASYLANACHIGSALSCVEIIESVYEFKKPKDIFIFAKASGVATLYCLLHGYKKASEYLRKYPLPSKQVPGIVWSGGSLGMGLSVAVGLAFSNRKRKVYCLISDGETQSGQTYEAIIFAYHHNLNNLIIIEDYNNLQSLGEIEDILHTRKWLPADEIDGHNKEKIKESILKVDEYEPNYVRCNTIKGRGISFMENDYTWHYRNLDKHGFKKALLELNAENG